MAILFGALASILIGGSDFLGRYGTRRSHAITTVAGALIGGIAISVVGVIVIPSVYERRDILLGVLSGLVVGLALATLYEAMATTSAAVAAPLVALGVALFPLGWDLAFGAELSWLIAAGVAVSLGSLLFVTYSPGLTGNIGRGIKIALVSALLWGVSTTLRVRTPRWLQPCRRRGTVPGRRPPACDEGRIVRRRSGRRRRARSTHGSDRRNAR